MDVSRAVALLFICDPEKEAQLPCDLLKKGYGLSSAEARLALILMKGHSLGHAAEINGVTMNTVRSQLKSIFAKTGVQRQSELVRILMGSSPSVRI